MSSILGVHFIPKHTGRHHYEYVAALRPRLAKLIGDSTPDVQQMADLYAAAPEAIHYWRNHALSEQHDALWRDPVGTAQRHVTELHRDIQARTQQAVERGLVLPPREQVRLLGINEPVIELFPRQEDMSNYGDWLRMMRERTPLLDAYMVHFAEAANNLGYGTGLGNFSTGTPANLKPGDYPTFDWFPRTAKLLEQTRGRNALAVHEYWTAAQGPEGWWDWHTCRFFHYQVNCDIDVLECGVEEAITGKPHQGWQGQLTAAQYAAQMDTYLRRARTDSRFRGATPFTLDGDKQWATFYVEGCVPEFLQLARDLDAKPSAATYTVHLPSLLSGTDPNANWVRSYPHVLRIEGGLSLDPNDPGNWYQGKLVGTKYGISAAVWGGQVDIPNLTEAQALDIYRQHYWRASGCENLPWPLCLVVFDTAVNHGVGVAQELLGQHSDPVEYLAHRMLVYVRLANWSRYGVAWGNRVKALLDVVRT